MMLSLYHKVTNRRACTVKKELQLQQCGAVNRGLLRTVHSATGARFEHPLRYLNEPSFMVLFQTAATHGPSTLYKCSVYPDRTPIPRMPRLMISRDSVLWVLDCRLVPPRPDASGAREGHARESADYNLFLSRKPDSFPPSTGWTAPSLRCRSVDPDFSNCLFMMVFGRQRLCVCDFAFVADQTQCRTWGIDIHIEVWNI